MKRGLIGVCHYVEELAKAIEMAKPYYLDNHAKISGKNSEINSFPSGPGVYLILRRVNLPNKDYRTRGVNVKTPLVLYVGKTTSRRKIKQRLHDHFGGVKMNFQGSQFRKFLFQICQDIEMVKRLLWSDETLIACVEINEGDAVIDYVETLAIQVFQPRFNIKDR